MVDRINGRTFTLLLLLLVWPVTSFGQDQAAPEAPAKPAEKGKMITIHGRIDSKLKELVLDACNQAVKDEVDVLIFDIKASNSDFGICRDLAFSIVDLSAKRTVAYVSGPVTGHPVLVALACDDIVMSPEGKLGDVYRDEVPRRPELDAIAYQRIARDTGRDPILPMGMLDASLVIHEVRTPIGKRFIAADKLAEFKRTTRVLEEKTVKEAGAPLLLDQAAAEKFGLSQRTARTRREVALLYELPEQIAAEDSLRAEADRPVLIKLEGFLDNQLYEYVTRRLRQAQSGGNNLLFVEIGSSSGDVTAVSNIANALARYGEQAKVVAWVPREAKGPAVLALFACDELVIAREAVIGDFEVLDDVGQAAVLADSAVRWAQGSKFPEAIVRGFIDPKVTVHQVQSKANPNVRTLVTEESLQTPEIQANWQNPRPVKAVDMVLHMTGEEARSLDVASGLAGTLDELQSLYDLNDRIQVLQPGWVDTMIQSLTSTGGTFFLLFLGIICLYLEFQIPGFGFAGLLSAACFALFFWSRFLVDQAHSLEVVMFLLGAVFLAIEIFILPGFGVAGISGLILIVCSLVLASQSFVIPANSEQTRELTVNVVTLAGALMVSMVAIVGLSRYFPRMPFLNRLMLNPPGDGEVSDDGFVEEEIDSPYAELLGKEGIAASPLRPAGRMQFDGRFYDVVAQGEFVEPGRTVEVVEVFRNRIVVRDARSA